jgi:hypothetical protein
MMLGTVTVAEAEVAGTDRGFRTNVQKSLSTLSR